MLSIRKSKWVFDTSATYEFGLGLLSTSGGKMVLNDPQGHSHNFRYSGFGLGASSAISKIKLPPLPVLNRIVSVTGSTENFHSRGWLYMTDSFSGDELARSDIQGGAIYLDCGAGLLATMKHEYIVQNALGGMGGTVTAVMYIKENSVEK